MQQWFCKIFIFIKIIFGLFNKSSIFNVDYCILLEQIEIVGPMSFSLTTFTSFFIGLVFSLQIVKEFLYLNAINLVGSVLTISFLRELSPTLTSIIFIGKIGSYFTAELATMNITEQIDALYVLGINPIHYLILPRILASIVMLPVLNILSFVISLLSSAFICFILYDIDTTIFFNSVFSALSIMDILKSSIKIMVFGLVISLISCVWGLQAKGGAKGVGNATTSSVINSLLFLFILDFVLSYYMFDVVDISLKN